MTALRTKHVHIDGDDERAVVEALREPELNGNAAVVERYEDDLRQYFSSAFALGYVNGTSAIHAALLAANVMPGDSVMVPPTAPVMTCLPILLAGARPVFVDVCSTHDFGISVEDLANKLTRPVKAIIAVPMWGYPSDLSEVLSFARSRSIVVIEDAAQAHGSEVSGQFVGTLADIGAFSTHDRKLVCTGEGGFLLTNDEQTYIRLKEIRGFGRLLRQIEGFESYVGQFGVQFGLNYKLNALAAALGRSQLVKLPQKLARRRSNARYIRERLEGLEAIREIPLANGIVPNYYALVLELMDAAVSSNVVARALMERGVESDTVFYDYKPLYRLPLFQDFASPCPNAETFTARILTVPTHEGLSVEDCDYIVDSISYSLRS